MYYIFLLSLLTVALFPRHGQAQSVESRDTLTAELKNTVAEMQRRHALLVKEGKGLVSKEMSLTEVKSEKGNVELSARASSEESRVTLKSMQKKNKRFGPSSVTVSPELSLTYSKVFSKAAADHVLTLNGGAGATGGYAMDRDGKGLVFGPSSSLLLSYLLKMGSHQFDLFLQGRYVNSRLPEHFIGMQKVSDGVRGDAQARYGYMDHKGHTWSVGANAGFEKYDIESETAWNLDNGSSAIVGGILELDLN